MPKSVALVTAYRTFGEVRSLAQQMPVWADSGVLPAIEIKKLRNAFTMITTYTRRPNETSAESVCRIVPTLDQHHNEVSSDDPYKCLVVIGVMLSEMQTLEPLRNCGFLEFEATEEGFIARKGDEA